MRTDGRADRWGACSRGGGTSAVAASAHAGCQRFRLTDPFLTRKTRKALAAHVGSPDTTAGIPEARWMRAMTFERLVHDDAFVSELLTKTIGQLEPASTDGGRPRDVQRVSRGNGEGAQRRRPQGDLRRYRDDDLGPRGPLPLPRGRVRDRGAPRLRDRRATPRRRRRSPAPG